MRMHQRSISNFLKSNLIKLFETEKIRPIENSKLSGIKLFQFRENLEKRIQNCLPQTSANFIISFTGWNNNQWNQSQQYGGSNSDGSSDANQQWMAYYQVRLEIDLKILQKLFFLFFNSNNSKPDNRIGIRIRTMAAHFHQTPRTTTIKRSNNFVAGGL